MRPLHLVEITVAIIASSLCGWEAKAFEAAAQAQQARPGLTTKAANDAERKKESEELAARMRREHPDWSEQQIADYVEGYSGFGISPDTYERTRAALNAAQTLRCQFPRGSYVDPADPNLTKHDQAGTDVTFDSIDRKRGTARIISTTGAADVTVFTGPTALTFLEIAPTGNPLITVVFPRFRAGTKEFYAADSEHIFAFGDMTIGQYYGTCKVLQ